MAEVFTSSIARTLKRTLNEIVDDKSDSLESKMVLKNWCQVKTMEDNYEDDQEYAGGGLISEKNEGGELATIAMREGYTKRYNARTFGARMMITEEAMEDCKYKEVIDLARRLKRSTFKTIDIDSTLMLMRMTNASYVGGDGVSLVSASHTLPHGGTFSNTMATPLSPSPEAVSVAYAVLDVMVGHDGIIEGYEIEKVVYPSSQHFSWLTVLKSEKNPENGNFAAINVANSRSGAVDITPVKNRYWQNSTTNYGFITDADNGLNLRYRRRPKGRSWVDNDNEVMKFSMSARWDRGWSDARGFYGVNA